MVKCAIIKLTNKLFFRTFYHKIGGFSVKESRGQTRNGALNQAIIR